MLNEESRASSFGKRGTNRISTIYSKFVDRRRITKVKKHLIHVPSKWSYQRT